MKMAIFLIYAIQQTLGRSFCDRVQIEGSSMSDHRGTFFVLLSMYVNERILPVVWRVNVKKHPALIGRMLFMFEKIFCYAMCIIRKIKLLYFSNNCSSASELYSLYKVGFFNERDVEALIIRIISLSWMIYRCGPMPVS